jgi:hypothetical protein
VVGGAAEPVPPLEQAARMSTIVLSRAAADLDDLICSSSDRAVFSRRQALYRSSCRHPHPGKTGLTKRSAILPLNRLSVNT